MFDITDIPIGRNNAITRRGLMKLWNCKDRTVRRNVAQLRASGEHSEYAILSTSHGDGYWRSNDRAEIQQFILETNARAIHTFKALEGAKMVLNNIGQVRMEV